MGFMKRLPVRPPTLTWAVERHAHSQGLAMLQMPHFPYNRSLMASRTTWE